MQNNWHSQTTNEVLTTLASSQNGLTTSEARHRLTRYGLNEIKQKSKKTSFDLLLEQFTSPLVYLLIIVAIITLFLKKYVDTTVIFSIVIINATVGWIQEIKAEKSLEAIKKLISFKSIIIRDKEEKEILVSEIVPGDIVVLLGGQKIPADMRIIESENLKIDESSLTGESNAIHKIVDPIKQNTPLADRNNMVYASTIVSSGKGLAVVTATGNNTEIGKIAKEVITTQDTTTPLNKKILQLGKIFLIVTIVVCALIFFLGLWRGENLLDIFLTSVSAAVSAIPEGLPALITIILAIGVHRMVGRNALVRKMQSVETLGSISVIASDKTGTLTLNQMFADKIYLPNAHLVHIEGKGYEPSGNFTQNQKIIDVNPTNDLHQLLLIGALCNDATLVLKDKKWLIQGDPTEGSLIVAAAKANITKPQLVNDFVRINEIQFETEIGYMATLHKNKTHNLLAVKGKIEKILELSTHYQDNGVVKIFDEQTKKQIEMQANQEAKNAYRIIAIAQKPDFAGNEITNSIMPGLTYLGFVCLEDPPKMDAIEAIKQCKLSGIRTIMITGDHPETALAIAKKMEIATASSICQTGQELEKLNATQLGEAVKNNSVFARITPQLKLNIVAALQNQGNIVAVTGDGINDAPVLKKADVGIAMNIGGTDVAKEASDIVLIDNNFTTIVAAIEEGRTIFLNIRRVIFYLISTNAGELTILITCLAINLPLPLIAIQLLWINMVTDTTGGIALSLEPQHKKIHEIAHDRLKENLIDKVTIVRIALVAITMTVGTIILYKMCLNAGASIEKARSIAFITMALFQIFNIFNAQSMTTSIFRRKLKRNYYVLPLALASVILTVLTTQTEFFRQIFHTQTLNFYEWIAITLVCASIFIVVEIDKAIRKS